MLNIKPVKIVSEDESKDITLPPANASDEEVVLPNIQNSPPPINTDDEDVEEFSSPQLGEEYEIDKEIDEEPLCKPNRLFGGGISRNDDKTQSAPTLPRKFPYVYVAMGVALLKYLF